MEAAVKAANEQVTQMKNAVRVAKDSSDANTHSMQDTLVQMKEQGRAIRQANNVSTKALHLNTLAFEATHRPYIGFDSVTLIRTENPNIARIRIEYRNVGTMPAKSIRIERTLTPSILLGNLSQEANSLPWPGISVLFPNMSHFSFQTITGASAIKRILDGQDKLSITASIYYQGMDGKKYYTTEVMEYSPASVGFSSITSDAN
jgi:hypothetical protein